MAYVAVTSHPGTGESQISPEPHAYWEFAMAVDRMEQPLRDLESQAPAIYLAPVSAAGSYQASEDWILEHALVVWSCLSTLEELICQKLVESFGKPGEPGNAEAIESCCSDILDCCRELASAERQITETSLHLDLLQTQREFCGLSLALLGQLAAMVAGFRRVVETGATGKVEFTVVIPTRRIEELLVPERASRATFCSLPWQVSLLLPGMWHWQHGGLAKAFAWYLGSVGGLLLCPPAGVLVWIFCVLDAKWRARRQE